MTNKEKRCDGCNELIRFKHLKKIRDKYYCKRCANFKRLEHRKETIEKANIKKDLKRLDKKIQRTYRTTKTIILEKKIKKKSNNIKKYNPLVLSMSLTDKQFLYKRKIDQGKTRQQADKEVRELQEHLIKLGKELRDNKKLTDLDKQNVFNKEFEKLCYN